MDTLAKDFFVEDFIGDREDVLRSIELLQMELDNFVNQHTDEICRRQHRKCKMKLAICSIHLEKVSIL